MKIHEATEQAYKNGYEDGKRDAEEEIRILKQKRANIFEIQKAYERGMDSAVKHGCWEERLVDYETQYYITDCSICGCSGERWYSYCPNCGSCMDDKINVPRMDGDGNG